MDENKNIKCDFKEILTCKVKKYSEALRPTILSRM